MRFKATPAACAIRSAFCALALCLAALSCSKTEDEGSPKSHTRPQKVADYLYELTFNDYDWATANSFASNLDNALMGGACTVVRSGSLVGRNNDCPYCEMAEGVVRVPAAEGRYASIGLASYIIDITPDMLENNPYNVLVDMMAFAITDGMNEKGLFCAVNSLPVADLEWTCGTNPGGTDLYTAMACRYLLDKAASAKEACELLSKANLKHSAVFREMHIFVADKDDTFIIETIGDEMVIVEPEVGVMTNFYQSLDHYTAHSCGVERYELAKSRVDEVTSVESLNALMKDLRYSRSYDRSVVPFWYSEYWLNHSMLFGKDITIDTPKEEYEADIDSEIELFQHRKRNVLLNLWVTTHSSIYDLEAKTLRVCVQEDFDHSYSFAL